MEDNQRDVQSPAEYAEIESPKESVPDLTSNTIPQTVRDYQTRVDDLNRENFDLKLRIFFLEQNTTNNTGASQRPRPSSQYGYYIQQDPSLLHQTGYENDQTRQFSSPNRHRPDIQTINENDETRPIGTRQENGKSRRTFHNSDDSEDSPTRLNIDSNTQTRRRTPPSDSELLTNMPVSTYNLPYEERERKTQDDISSLKKENTSLKTKLNEASNDLQRINDQYQAQVRQNEDQNAKAERVIKRLKADYDARIANMEEEQRQKSAEYESYRHEKEQTNSNVNIEEYLRKIDHQDRIIKQLQDKLHGTTANQQKPYTVLLPSSINPQSNDDNIRRLNEQVKSYVETIDVGKQLRAECDELRRSEKYLRKQIDDLNRLFEPSNGRLPTAPRSSIIDDIQPTEDPQTVIVQIAVQLRTDAENISGLTNRVAQTIRERDENLNKLKEKDSQVRQYEIREKDFEDRVIQKSDIQLEELQHDIKKLQNQLENRDRRIKELADENDQLKLKPKYEKRPNGTTDSSENPRLQEQLQVAERTINDLRQRLNNEQQLYDDLQKEYDKLKTDLDAHNVETLEHIIEQQKKQITNGETQLQELENNFEQQRAHLEREREFEKAKVNDIQNELDTSKKRYNELQSQYEQLRPLLDEQQHEYEKKLRTYQQDLAQIEQEKDDLIDEIDFLKHEKQASIEQMRETDPKYVELAQTTKELQDQISRYEVRFHDNEDDNKRFRNEFNTLQNNYQTKNQEFDDVKSNYDKIQNDLITMQSEKDQIETEYQNLNQENDKLKHELEELEIRIRLQVNQEYENQYRDRLNDLNEHKDAEIHNVQRDKEAIEFELERVNHERARFEKQLQEAQNELQNATETIENYEKDMNRLQGDLKRLRERNEQIEQDLSRTYADQLKEQNDRIQDLENQIKTNAKQMHEYEQYLPNLAQRPLNQQTSNYYERPEYDDNDQPRYDRRQTIPNNQDLIYQLENKLREQDDVIHSLRNSRSIVEGEPTDIELELQIRIQGLEDNLQKQDRFIEKQTQTIQTQQEQIEKLLENLQKGENSDSDTIGILREELQNQNKRIDDILTEKDFIIDQNQHEISKLKRTIQDRDHRLANIDEKLEQSEQQIDEQQLKIDHLERENKRLNIVSDEQAYLDQIRDLENELQMEKNINNATPSEQRDRYESLLEDLKNRLKKRDEIIQRQKRYISSDENLNDRLRDANDELKVARQDQNKTTGSYNRLNLERDQLTSDVENRDQSITSLRQKLAEKDQEINKLRESNFAQDQKLTELYSKMMPTESDPKRPPPVAERPATVVSLRSELQRKDREIEELKQKLAAAQHETPDDSDSTPAPTLPKERRTRPRPNFDHLNREELLRELDMALQQNQDLNDQLKQKYPNKPELFNQIVEVRDELARQKYINQVLWRKLDALIDIQGSNTRAELAIELANYQDELAKLKLQHHRTNDARSAILNANSRSSSEQNLSISHPGSSSMTNDFPSKNIKSTIALLERTNIEWQTKVARLTEQLGRTESQSRNYHRELIKYQKLLYDSGLVESSVRQRRRSADDSVIISLYESNKITDDLTNIENIDELKEIIRNERKYNQQLQTRIRLNTPDLIQSPVIEKLNEQIQSLNLVIDTYKNESTLLKNELKKLYKTLEYNRKTSQQYEQLIKDQQATIEQSNQKLTKCDQLLKKYNIHLPIFDDKTEHIIDPIEEYIIDLDIDIIQGSDIKKKTSLGKRDSAYSSPTDSSDFERRIREKDDQIRNLSDELKNKNKEIQQIRDDLLNSKKSYENVQQQNRIEYDRINQDLTDELHQTKNDLQQARSQVDKLKTSKPQYDQIEEQNQRLRAEIKHLENEVERAKPLIEHYKNQIDILERRTIPISGNEAAEMIIRKSELSQLLEEMRLLRRDLERSLQKQNELQAKLDENLRQSQSPREFTFTGRGISYPDLRLVGTENISFTSLDHEKRSRPLGSSANELDNIEYPQLSSRDTPERIIPTKPYVVGEVRTHNDLGRLVGDIKVDLKAMGPELKDKFRSKTGSSILDASTRSLEERLISLDERLTHVLDLMDTYWTTDLPEKNKDNEHHFIDPRFIEENKRLLLAQRKYIQDINLLKQKYREQSTHIEQLLVQLTKSNQKKADAGDYLTLLLRPTLDVLQKARSNMEHHLKETNTNNSPPGSARAHRHHRRRHSNRQD